MAANVLFPLPWIIIANAAIGRSWAHLAIAILTGFSAGITFLIGALDVAGAGTLIALPGAQSRLPLDVGFMATASIAAALASQPVRERVSRLLPLDPDNPVHAFALVLAVIFFGTQVSAILFTSLATTPESAVGVGDLIAQEAGFVILAAAGVGIFMRRTAVQTAERLGLVRPAWWHVALALAAAGVFFAIAQAMDDLSRILTPDLYRQVRSNTDQLFGGLVSGPVGIAAIALAPGICEEILFRGALQPRIGLIATALLFASFHVQYGLSFDTLGVFVIALGLGSIRKFTNTTTSAISHSAYNLLVAIGIADSNLYVAAGVEVVLVAVSAYGIWSVRRRQAKAEESDLNNLPRHPR
ncbi:MAG: CPBP family intramembrane glutamic endopeptidase [Candidatus Dormibacteraceae bacterium]